MFQKVLIPSKNNATVTLPTELYGLEVKVVAIPVKMGGNFKRKKQLLPPHINTSNWKFIEKKQMNGNVFLDTNILIYAYSLSDVKKQFVSSEILLNANCVVSTQVLNEYCNVCSKKYFMQISEILLDIDNILDNCELVKIDEITIKQALFIKNSYGYSYYDSLILASALECDCPILYSEDLQHGQIIENSLKIMNPFAS